MGNLGKVPDGVAVDGIASLFIVLGLVDRGVGGAINNVIRSRFPEKRSYFVLTAKIQDIHIRWEKTELGKRRD
jgi:hypothetical protein